MNIYTILYTDGDENDCHTVVATNREDAYRKFREKYAHDEYELEILAIDKLDLKGFRLVKLT